MLIKVNIIQIQILFVIDLTRKEFNAEIEMISKIQKKAANTENIIYLIRFKFLFYSVV